MKDEAEGVFIYIFPNIENDNITSELHFGEDHSQRLIPKTLQC